MTPLDQARATFQTWLHLPDTGALDVVLGSIAANRISGDPVWLLLVGPPGGGKSEILNAISGLEDAHPAGTLTEASLLSGTPKRDHAEAAKGGLLRNIGDYGIIVAKDFGSVLSMNRDARSQLLAALREVYDGSWTRHVGTDGGRTLAWKGKVGMVGGCTPTIDRHHAVMGAMGERFVLYRLPEVDPNIQARRALLHAGKEKQMRQELAASVQTLLDEHAQQPRPLDDAETDRLIVLATLVVRARSAVERDNYSREIELVPGPEAPTRLIIVLDRILAGLDAIGATREDAWRVVTKCALDSVPALRLAILYALQNGQADTNNISGTVRHPAQTTRRALEDLVAHGLVELERQGEGKAHLWSLSEFTYGRMQVFPEMSGDHRTFPEMSEGVSTLPAFSSSKDSNKQNGNANNQHDLQTSLSDFEETQRYKHIFANEPEADTDDHPDLDTDTDLELKPEDQDALFATVPQDAGPPDAERQP